MNSTMRDISVYLDIVCTELKSIGLSGFLFFSGVQNSEKLQLTLRFAASVSCSY